MHLYYRDPQSKFMNNLLLGNLISLGSLLVSLICGSVWLGALSGRVKSLEGSQKETVIWKSRIENKLDNMQQETSLLQQETNRLIHDCKDSIIVALHESGV